MLVQDSQPYFLHRARIVRRSPSVIDHPVVCAFARDPGFAKKAAALVCMNLRRETTLSVPVIVSFDNIVTR